MNTVLAKKYKFFITVFIASLLILTTLISVGFGALNQNLSIAGDVEYVEDIGNMMMEYTRDSTVNFHNQTYEDKIKTVDFLDNKNIPNTAIISWDISKDNDGKVMAWLINDTSNTGYYKLYIGADGDVVANYTSGYIFYGMAELVTINLNDNLDTSKVTNMSAMFSTYHWDLNGGSSSFPSKLTAINGMQYMNTSRVTDMSYMFAGDTALATINLSNFDTSNVTTMESFFGDFFSGACKSLTSIDVSGFNTSNVKNMDSFFYGCRGVTTIDVHNFNTSKVTNMSSMFAGCTGITSLNVSNFDTSKVTNMYSMFSGIKVSSLNLSNFNTSNVTNMSFMFGSSIEDCCTNITTLDLSNFNTSKVTNMSFMFFGCTSLTNLNISSFDTSKVTNMMSMFSTMSGSANNLSILDLRSFDTSKVTNMNYMFNYCDKLTQIKISSLWSIASVTESNSMFSYCTKLPNYNYNYVDATMAKPTTQGGYMTLV